MYSSSSAQKLNARSSTDSELIRIHDGIPFIIWVGRFLKAQGIDIDVVLFQDNQSTILLANNGRLSSTKRTRHIDARYYFVKDRIAKGDLRIEYCPTLDMVADYFTKPLQGMLFFCMRDAIMGTGSESEFHSSRRKLHSSRRSVLGKDENAKNLQSTNVTTNQQSENVTAVVAVSADVVADGQCRANVPVPGCGTY